MPAPADASFGGQKRPAGEIERAGTTSQLASTDVQLSGNPAPKKAHLDRVVDTSALAHATDGTTASSDATAMPGRAPLTPRYLLRVQYDGSNFHGFQRQAESRTVQGCVEEALRTFARGGADGRNDRKGDERVKIDSSGIISHGSSRTDAGVHALDATLHVDLERTSKRHPDKIQRPYAPETVMSAVNHFLRRAGSDDVRVWRCHRVDPERFHARYSATGRTYTYRIRVAPSCDPPGVFEAGKVWHVVRDVPLDVAKMRAAARHLLGTHDFSAFRAAGCQASSPVRSVDVIDVSADDRHLNAFSPGSVAGPPDDFAEIASSPSRGDGEEASAREGRIKPARPEATSVVLTFSAPSFLYHQVRLMVAALVGVGRGDLTPEDVLVLLAKKDSKLVPPMAPAHGLYLARVHYDGTRKWDARRDADEKAKDETS
jgi:tRNA pseudouridine38-40 synthase